MSESAAMGVGAVDELIRNRPRRSLVQDLGRPARLVLLVSGRGSNMEALLAACQGAGVLRGIATVVAVGSDRENAPALAKAAAAGVPQVRAFRFDRGSSRAAYDQALEEQLQAWQPDLICLAGYLRLLAPTTVQRWLYRIVNIHPALLPAFPGLHAQRQAVEYGVRVSGCTVHLVDAGMDTGPILLQEAVPVWPGDTEETLAARILPVEHRLYVQAVHELLTRPWQVVGRRVIWQ